MELDPNDIIRAAPELFAAFREVELATPTQEEEQLDLFRGIFEVRKGTAQRWGNDRTGPFWE